MRYLARKLGFYVLAAWLAITLNFLLPQLIPGNPVQLLLAKMHSAGPTPPGEEQSLARMLGLGSGNVLQRYGAYLDNLAHLRFGLSITDFPTPVTTEIGDTIVWTLVLVGTATVISFVIGIGLGALAGWKRGTWLDSLVPATTFLTAIPYFWLALILLYLFSDNVSHWLPGFGGYDTNSDLTVGLERPVPRLGRAARDAAGADHRDQLDRRLAAGMRNMMVATLSEDYVVAAEAKGLRPVRVAIGYAARNAVLPSVSGFAISLGFVVSGSIVMETVFSYPGIGAKLLEAVQNNDYPLMQGIFLVITFAVLGANLIVDLLYGFVDPRTRMAR